jgi:signal transduction histidine kinase
MGTCRVIPALRRPLLLAVILAFSPISAAWAQTYKQGLIVYATRRESQIAVLSDRYLPRLLHQALEGDFDLQSEYLDLARISDPAYEKVFAAFLRSKFSGAQFDVVITMQDAAYRFVLANRELFGDAPIVFVTASAATERAPNSAGLFIPNDFTRTLALARTLQPSTRNVLVVSGADPRDREYERAARAQFKPLERDLQFTYLAGLRTNELEQRLANPPKDSIVLYLVVNRDGAGDTYHPLEYLDRVTEVARAPVYAWTDSTMGHGIVGGGLKDQQAQTEAVGQLVLRVLRGEPADGIPIEAPALQVDEVDWRQLQRWNIPVSRLPWGTRILNRDPSPWDRYRPYVVVAAILVMGQTSLIAGLLIQGKRRRLAEEQLRKNQSELRNSYERTRDLGARLLHAQDVERARIARELHDDISQQLALLQIDLERLNATVDGPAATLTQSTLSLSRNLSKSVHDLSHELHPEKVRLIGLMAAVRGLQRDLSARSDVSISLQHDELPPISPDVTLCLFRVTQEALQNAVKHGSAHEVSIELRCSEGQLTLSVIDDGIGFDVERAWAKGLGLISMAERLESIGGTLIVQSAPGEGTRLKTTVLLAEPSALRSAG